MERILGAKKNCKKTLFLICSFLVSSLALVISTYAWFALNFVGFEEHYYVEPVTVSLNGNFTTPENPTSTDMGLLVPGDEYELTMEVENHSSNNAYTYNVSFGLVNHEGVTDAELAPAIEVYEMDRNNQYSYVGMLDKIAGTALVQSDSIHTGALGGEEIDTVKYKFVYSYGAGEHYEGLSFSLNAYVSADFIADLESFSEYYINSVAKLENSSYEGFINGKIIKITSDNAIEIIGSTSYEVFQLDRDIVFDGYKVSFDLNGHILDLNGHTITVSYTEPSGVSTNDIARIFDSEKALSTSAIVDTSVAQTGQMIYNVTDGFVFVESEFKANTFINTQTFSTTALINYIDNKTVELSSSVLSDSDSFPLFNDIEYYFENYSISGMSFSFVNTDYIQLGTYISGATVNSPTEDYSYNLISSSATITAPFELTITYPTSQTIILSGNVIINGNGAEALAQAALAELPNVISESIFLKQYDVKYNAYYQWAISNDNLLSDEGVYLPNGYASLDSYDDQTIQVSLQVESNGIQYNTHDNTKTITVKILTPQERINRCVYNSSISTVAVKIDEGATASGTINMVLAGTSTAVDVTLGDTISQVADKIAAKTYTGWTTSVSLTNDSNHATVTFTPSLASTNTSGNSYLDVMSTGIVAQTRSSVNLDSIVLEEAGDTYSIGLANYEAASMGLVGISYAINTQDNTYGSDTQYYVKIDAGETSNLFDDVIQVLHKPAYLTARGVSIVVTFDFGDEGTVSKNLETTIVGYTTSNQTVSVEAELRAILASKVPESTYESFALPATTSSGIGVTYSVDPAYSSYVAVSASPDANDNYAIIIYRALAPSTTGEVTIYATTDNELVTIPLTFNVTGIIHNNTSGIPDATLFYKIFSYYNLDNDDWLTIDEISNPDITTLDFSNSDITDITGIEYLTSVVSLDLSDNTISDISALSNLYDLVTLDLSSNETIADISYLSYLDNLRNLNLSGNAITSITGLQYLTDIQVLDLSDNMIDDFTSLENFDNITTLNVYDNIASLDFTTKYVLTIIYLASSSPSLSISSGSTYVPADDAQVATILLKNVYKANNTISTLNTPTTYTYNGVKYYLKWTSGNTLLSFDPAGNYTITSPIVNTKITLTVSVRAENSSAETAIQRRMNMTLRATTGATVWINIGTDAEPNYVNAADVIPDISLLSLIFGNAYINNETAPVTIGGTDYANDHVITYTERTTAPSLTFSWAGAGITDLNGLNYMTGLTYLDLSNNIISNLSIVDSLVNLSTLKLSGALYDFDDLLSLSNLTSLYVYGCYGLDTAAVEQQLYHVYKNNKGNAISIYKDGNTIVWNPYLIPLQRTLNSYKKIFTFNNLWGNGTTDIISSTFTYFVSCANYNDIVALGTYSSDTLYVDCENAVGYYYSDGKLVSTGVSEAIFSSRIPVYFYDDTTPLNCNFGTFSSTTKLDYDDSNKAPWLGGTAISYRQQYYFQPVASQIAQYFTISVSDPDAIGSISHYIEVVYEPCDEDIYVQNGISTYENIESAIPSESLRQFIYTKLFTSNSSAQTYYNSGTERYELTTANLSSINATTIAAGPTIDGKFDSGSDLLKGLTLLPGVTAITLYRVTNISGASLAYIKMLDIRYSIINMTEIITDENPNVGGLEYLNIDTCPSVTFTDGTNSLFSSDLTSLSTLKLINSNIYDFSFLQPYVAWTDLLAGAETCPLRTLYIYGTYNAGKLYSSTLSILSDIYINLYEYFVATPLQYPNDPTSYLDFRASDASTPWLPSSISTTNEQFVEYIEIYTSIESLDVSVTTSGSSVIQYSDLEDERGDIIVYDSDTITLPNKVSLARNLDSNGDVITSGLFGSIEVDIVWTILNNATYVNGSTYYLIDRNTTTGVCTINALSMDYYVILVGTIGSNLSYNNGTTIVNAPTRVFYYPVLVSGKSYTGSTNSVYTVSSANANGYSSVIMTGLEDLVIIGSSGSQIGTYTAGTLVYSYRNLLDNKLRFPTYTTISTNYSGYFGKYYGVLDYATCNSNNFNRYRLGEFANKYIYSLEGIQMFKQIYQYMEFPSNYISDLSPISQYLTYTSGSPNTLTYTTRAEASLNVTSLKFGNNQITSLEPIKYCSNVRYYYFRNNLLTKISDGSGIPYFRSISGYAVDIQNNQVSATELETLIYDAGYPNSQFMHTLLYYGNPDCNTLAGATAFYNIVNGLYTHGLSTTLINYSMSYGHALADSTTPLTSYTVAQVMSQLSYILDAGNIEESYGFVYLKSSDGITISDVINALSDDYAANSIFTNTGDPTSPTVTDKDSYIYNAATGYSGTSTTVYISYKTQTVSGYLGTTTLTTLTNANVAQVVVQVTYSANWIVNYTLYVVNNSATASKIYTSAGDSVGTTLSTAIPDSAFRTYLLYMLDANDDGSLSWTEVQNLSTINITSDYGIQSLEGIKYFVNLSSITVTGNQITAIPTPYLDSNGTNDIGGSYGYNTTITLLVLTTNELGNNESGTGTITDAGSISKLDYYQNLGTLNLKFNMSLDYNVVFKTSRHTIGISGFNIIANMGNLSRLYITALDSWQNWSTNGHDFSTLSTDTLFNIVGARTLSTYNTLDIYNKTYWTDNYVSDRGCFANYSGRYYKQSTYPSGMSNDDTTFMQYLQFYSGIINTFENADTAHSSLTKNNTLYNDILKRLSLYSSTTYNSVIYSRTNVISNEITSPGQTYTLPTYTYYNGYKIKLSWTVGNAGTSSIDPTTNILTISVAANQITNITNARLTFTITGIYAPDGTEILRSSSAYSSTSEYFTIEVNDATRADIYDITQMYIDVTDDGLDNYVLASTLISDPMLCYYLFNDTTYINTTKDNYLTYSEVSETTKFGYYTSITAFTGDAIRSRVTSIEGLQYFTNLKSVWLYRTLVDDLSPLANMHLVSFTLDSSASTSNIYEYYVVDMMPLLNSSSTLQNFFYYGRASITDFSFLKTFTALSSVTFNVSGGIPYMLQFFTENFLQLKAWFSIYRPGVTFTTTSITTISEDQLKGANFFNNIDGTDSVVINGYESTYESAPFYIVVTSPSTWSSDYGSTHYFTLTINGETQNIVVNRYCYSTTQIAARIATLSYTGWNLVSVDSMVYFIPTTTTPIFGTPSYDATAWGGATGVVMSFNTPSSYDYSTSFIISKLPTTAGNITITLFDEEYVIGLTTSDDTITEVAAKIVAASYDGWIATVDYGDPRIVTFTPVSTLLGARGELSVIDTGNTGFVGVIYRCTDQIGGNQTVTVDITSDATQTGTISLNLRDKIYTMSVTSGESASTIVAHLAALTYEGWSVTANGSTLTLTSTKLVLRTGSVVVNGGTTGVSGTASIIMSGTLPTTINDGGVEYPIKWSSNSGYITLTTVTVGSTTTYTMTADGNVGSTTLGYITAQIEVDGVVYTKYYSVNIG